MMCYMILNLNQKCQYCGFPLSNDEANRQLQMDGYKPLCFQCINKLY